MPTTPRTVNAGEINTANTREPLVKRRLACARLRRFSHHGTERKQTWLPWRRNRGFLSESSIHTFGKLAVRTNNANVRYGSSIAVRRLRTLTEGLVLSHI